jgi:hypothetical protein
MGFELVFAVRGGPDEGVSAGDLASNHGLAAFYTWVDGLDDSFPELHNLVEEGNCAGIKEIAAELRLALGGEFNDPSPEVTSVAKRLLTLLKAAPAGSEGFVITS